MAMSARRIRISAAAMIGIERNAYADVRMNLGFLQFHWFTQRFGWLAPDGHDCGQVDVLDQH